MTPASREAVWRTAVDKVVRRPDAVGSLVTLTPDAIPIAPLYPAAETAGPVGARPRCSVMARLDDPRTSALDEVENGADGLLLVFAGAGTARGFGLEPATLADVLRDVAIEHLPLRLDPALFGGLEAVRALLEVADARGIDAAALDLDVGLDVPGFVARAGEAPAPPRGIVPLVAELVGVLRDRGVAGPWLRADGRPFHEAGATEAQELAAVLASGVTSLRGLEAAGGALGDGRRGLSFLLAADADELLTVAKFRAMRVLWARIEELCGLAPAPIRLHAETSWRMMTSRDPHTNLLRATIACTGAMLGGADGVTVLPFTSALGLAEAGARRLARNTGLVLRDEAGLDRVADPAAGSGAIEALTEALCERAWTLFGEIERSGGLAQCLADGSWAARLAESRERRRRELREGTRPLVGVTVHPLATEVPVAVVAFPPERPAPRPGALPSLRDEDLLAPGEVS